LQLLAANKKRRRVFGPAAPDERQGRIITAAPPGAQGAQYMGNQPTVGINTRTKRDYCDRHANQQADRSIIYAGCF